MAAYQSANFPCSLLRANLFVFVCFSRAEPIHSALLEEYLPTRNVYHRSAQIWFHLQNSAPGPAHLKLQKVLTDMTLCFSRNRIKGPYPPGLNSYIERF
jgi:hypothetical protein